MALAIQNASKLTQQSMIELQESFKGIKEPVGLKISEEEVLGAITIKLGITINLYQGYKDLVKEIGDPDSQQLVDAKFYIPYMIDDHLYLETSLEMDQIEQAIDNHKIKALAQQEVEPSQATPGQQKYVHILNEYEKELSKLSANP